MRQPNILDYLPEVFKVVSEIQAHADAENPELRFLWEAVENAYNDQFLYTMGENGIKRWENMLGVTPLDTDTIEDRRFRIINRVNAQLPYTYRMLEYHLNQMCGTNGYTMSYDKNTWTLRIRVSLEKRNQYSEVLRLVTEMIPMNILLDYSLLYNSHKVLAAFTHKQLSANTHNELRNKVLK